MHWLVLFNGYLQKVDGVVMGRQIGRGDKGIDVSFGCVR